MSSGEKKVAAVLGVVLVALVAVYFGTQSKGRGWAGASGPGAAAAAGATCAPGTRGRAAETQELGEPGAKLEIIAVIPIAIGCHAATERELKKAYEKHPDDIHLIIADLMGPDAATYRAKVRVGWAVVSINGSSTFELNGRRVKLEQMENATYRPSDIVPIIDAEVEKLS